MLAPVAWRTPPLHYGPWERVTSLLTEALVRRGVQVTLFATADSQTAGRLEAVVPHGYAEDPSMDGRVWEAIHVARALARSADFDLVHNQLDWLPLAFSELCAVPMVTTIHGFSDPRILPAYQRAGSPGASSPGAGSPGAGSRGVRSHYVAISEADRSPDLDYAAVIHHGIDMDELPAGPGGDDLVAFGRIHPDKGTAQAIAIALATGRRLIICGIVQDENYFAEQVEPHIDGRRVVYRGSVGPEERAAVLGSAAVLLHPIAFPEPFGLSVWFAAAISAVLGAYIIWKG